MESEESDSLILGKPLFEERGSCGILCHNDDILGNVSCLAFLYGPFEYNAIVFWGYVSHLWNNRLSGEIPSEVLETERWKRNKHELGPQQKGYGFTNFQ